MDFELRLWRLPGFKPDVAHAAVATQIPMAPVLPECTAPSSASAVTGWWLVLAVRVQVLSRRTAGRPGELTAAPFSVPAASTTGCWAWGKVPLLPRGRSLHFSSCPRVPQQDGAPFAHSVNLLNSVLFTGFLPFCLISPCWVLPGITSWVSYFTGILVFGETQPRQPPASGMAWGDS